MITYVATRDGPLFGVQYGTGQIVDISDWTHKEIQRLLSAGSITSQSTSVTSDGVSVPSRSALEFSGRYVSLVDDPANNATIVQVDAPSTVGLGPLKVWRDGNTAATLSTSASVAYGSIWSYTFVAGRYYEFTLGGHGTASATTNAYGSAELRLGTSTSAVALAIGYIDQSLTEAVFYDQRTLLCGTDFASGTSALSVTGHSATGTITLGSSVLLNQTRVRVVDLGVF